MMKKILILALSIFSFLLVSCNKLPDKNYEDFNHMDHWDELNNLTDVETILFYYSPFCTISQSIEEEATEYFVMLEEEGVPIYLIHEGMIFEQGEQPLEVIETPSILVYKNKEFQEIISGAKPVINFLKGKFHN